MARLPSRPLLICVPHGTPGGGSQLQRVQHERASYRVYVSDKIDKVGQKTWVWQ